MRLVGEEGRGVEQLENGRAFRRAQRRLHVYLENGAAIAVAESSTAAAAAAAEEAEAAAAATTAN